MVQMEYIYFQWFLLCFQPTPTSRFVMGYVGAVTSAVGIAVSGI